jgi:hypothetical protein
MAATLPVAPTRTRFFLEDFSMSVELKPRLSKGRGSAVVGVRVQHCYGEDQLE